MTEEANDQERDEHDINVSDAEKTSVSDENEVESNVDKSTDADQQPPPPPASFEMLISMLFSQAMTMLGQIPDPQTGKLTTNKPYAKYTIDTLDILSKKTEGNLTDSESKMLSQTLHALRMGYVETK